MNEDSIKLLKECYSGCTMAINSIDQVQEFVKDDSLLTLLEEYKNEHEHLKEQSGEFLNKYHNACDNAIKLAKELIRSEEEFSKKMENFL